MVVHKADKRRFVVAGHEEAYIEYELVDSGKTMDLQHTFVPDSMRGQGVAAEIANFDSHPLPFLFKSSSTLHVPFM